MNERTVNVIEFKTYEAQSDNDQIQTRTIVNDANGMPMWKENIIDVSTITETEIVPPLKSEMVDRAKQLLTNQGFTRNKDAEYGRNNLDEVWEKVTRYAADEETVNLAKIVLHDVLTDNERVIARLIHDVKAYQSLIDDKQATIYRLQQSIKTATLYQRVKFLFGGGL